MSEEIIFMQITGPAKVKRKHGPTKKLKKSLTLAEMIAVIKLHSTESVDSLAKKFDCGPETINYILLYKDDHLKDWEDKNDPSRVRREHLARLLAHRHILYLWVQRCQSYPIRITDDILRDKGVEIARFVGLPGLRIFNAWLRNFKHKFKLKDEDLFNNDIINNKDESEQKSLNIEDIISDMKESGPLSKYNILEFKRTELPATTTIDLDPDDSWPDVSMTESNEPDQLQMQADDDFSWGNSEPMTYNNVEAKPPSPFSFTITEVRSLHTTPPKEDNKQEVKDYKEAVSKLSQLENLQTSLPKKDKKQEFNEIKDYKEAISKLGQLENFLLLKENIRAVGLVNQLENIFRDELSKL